MERWENSQQRRKDFQNQNPSFSSTLLDSIYRSIDEPNVKNLREEEKEFVFYKEKNTVTTKKKKQQQEEVPSAQERWTQYVQPVSLDTKIKPIRTSVERSQEKPNKSKSSSSSNSINGSFVKTRSKAMKLYSDLKKVKQPISPGGRLATFLNSIFMAGNTKKPKISPSNSSNSNSSSYSISSSTKFDQQTPTCSSTSSFSRSCLSKTPSSSRGNNINNVKRSVRFYPVSIIVDEDSKPCGQKNLHETTRSSSDQVVSELDVRVMEENRRVVEAAKELLKNYRKKKEEYDYNFHVINNGGMDLDLEDDDDDDDDIASCASSDLFELDNLSAVGYREELPVYETTHVRTNRAIANGLMI